MAEEKALRRAKKGKEREEEDNEEGGRVDRDIYCTTVGQRIDFMPHRSGIGTVSFFPPLVSASEKRRERETERKFIVKREDRREVR